MLSVGLTGGIGAGKSTVARHLAALGAVVLDADHVAREVVAPGTPGLAAVTARFGPGILGPHGGLDRGALAALVFADAEARAALNAVVHPLVARRTAELARALPPDSVVVHDIPLLVENHLAARYHLVVVVDAEVSVRTARLVRDRGMPPGEAERRIAAQASAAERRGVADVWLDNDGAPALLRTRVEDLWRRRLLPFEENLRAGRVAPAAPPADPALGGGTSREASLRAAARVAETLGRRACLVRIPAPPRTGQDLPPAGRAPAVMTARVEIRLTPGTDPARCARDLAAAGFPRRTDVHVLGAHGAADPGQPAHLRVVS